jgi:hypothetical protein
MTDREVEALSHFLRHFGNFGCRQISGRRTEPRSQTPEEVGRFVLETLAAWRAEGLDAERLYKVATIAIHFEAYKPALDHVYAGVLPTVGRAHPRVPARAGPPRDRRTVAPSAHARGLGPRLRRMRRCLTT